MRPVSPVRLAIAVIAITTAGCARDSTAHPSQDVARANAAPAAVEGDVYLVMQSGDTKKGAGRTIYLIRDTDSLQSDIGRQCEPMAAVIAATSRHLKGIQDSMQAIPGIEALLARRAREAMEAQDRRLRQLKDTIDAILIRSVVDTTGTGLNAHYKFDWVTPGRYLLFGEWPIGDRHYHWVAPISLAPGQAMKRDLDNSAEATHHLYCGTIAE